MPVETTLASVVVMRAARRVYGHLPPSTRDAAASAYGWYLRWWRYGADSERLVGEALEREAWPADRWHAYQVERVAPLLHRAATRVPYYREAWRARRAAGDHSSWDELANWPVLRKDDVRMASRALIADDVSTSRLFKVNTSGTSGTPLTLWRSRRSTIAWYALFEARTRRWYGVDRHMPWALLGGQVVVPPEQAQPPFWVWNTALRQLYLSSLHLNERNVAAYLDALGRHGIAYLYGYASSMAWLARLALDAGVPIPQLKVAVSNAEPLHDHQRRVIAEAFRCPVRDTYGMVESVAAASECHEGGMHVWPDAGLVEVFDEADRGVPTGVAGRLICTGLLNDVMPLIRYDVGDRAALADVTDEPDGCGRRLPLLERIEGRVSDNLVTRDGRRVFWINPVFYDLAVREAQVVQESLDRVVVSVVVDDGWNAADEDTIAQRLGQRLAGVNVVVRRVRAIPRGANGKFRPVVNLVDSTPGGDVEAMPPSARGP